jgi:serine/threonine protein kinase
MGYVVRNECHAALRSEEMGTSLQERVGDGIRVIQVLHESGAELLVTARDLERHVPVVLKVLDLQLATDPDALQRFEREAAGAPELRHFNIATAQPLQRRPDLAFYALNVGYAWTLESILASESPPSLEESVAILRSVASAIDYAHAHGTVHGRLEPEMIFVDDDDHVMVSGFDASGGADFASGPGSESYRAPEQCAWRYEIDGRTDVYALGVIAFELISGERHAATVPSEYSVAELLSITREVPLRAGVSLHVNEAIMHAVATRPSLRYSTAGEFIAALEACHPEPVPDVLEAIPAVRLTLAWRPIFTRRLAAPIGIGLLCVLGAFTLFSLRNRIRVPHVSSPFISSLFRSSSRGQLADTTVADTPSLATPIHKGSDAASSRRGRMTTSGVVVENGVLVFPGESGTDPRAFSSRSANSAWRPGRRRSRTTDSTSSPDSAASRTASHGFVRVLLEGGSETVLIDGVPRGNTPLFTRLATGPHSISLTGSGPFTPARVDLNLSRGDTALAAFSTRP